MESMPAPTYMHPGEDPNEVLARLVAYVNQQDQINEHPVYGQPPNTYARPEPVHPGPQTHYDASEHMMQRVLTGLRRLDTADDPVRARRPAAPAQGYAHPVPTVPGPYDRPQARQGTVGRQPARASGTYPAHRQEQLFVETAPMPAPRRDTRPNRQPTEPAWLADEVLDRKFAEFMKSWDDEPGQDAHQARHRRERTRMERISARIGAGLGAIATVAAVAYAGLELYSRVRGR